MKKILSLLLVAIVVLTGCGNAGKTDDGKLSGTIKVAVEGEAYGNYVKKVAEDFTKETGVKVEVVDVAMFDVIDALPTQKGNAPDVMLAPNDRIGQLADQKLIVPIEADIKDYTDTAKTAATYNDKTYLLPMSTDTTLLVYNKDKLATAPATLKEIPADQFLAKYTDFYHAAGMFYNQGGYIFGDNNVKTTDVGLNTDGAVKAGEIIQSYYNSGNKYWTLMKDDTVAYDIMKEAFIKGEVSAVIDGPWALKDYKKAGVNYGIAPIPSYDGTGTYAPLVGTKGFVVNAYSKNIAASQAFVKYLATPANAQLWYETTQEVSPHNGVKYEAGSEAQIILDATKVGTSMPNDPAFGKVWEPMGAALKQIAAGANVKDSLDAAVKVINNDISAMKK